MKKELYLNNLELNKQCKVIDILCDKPTKRRFLDLGIITGTFIKPLFRSPFSDPTAYEINNTVIAIRNEDASKIVVKKVEQERTSITLTFIKIFNTKRAYLKSVFTF